MDKIAVIDFGGQYAHLIANRVRRLGVYAEILSPETLRAEFAKFQGIILSGGPQSVYAKGAPAVDPCIYSLGIPVLGLCYGHQLTAHLLGGKVVPGKTKEYGLAQLTIKKKIGIFEGVQSPTQVWMSHGDAVSKAPPGFAVMANTADCAIAAMGDPKRRIFSTQFHVEVTHTQDGMKMLDNFLNLCRVEREWNTAKFLEKKMEEMHRLLAGRKVFLMVSGGVDSTVAYALLAKTLGSKNVYGLFVDTGLLRKNEGKKIAAALKKVGIKNFHVAQAKRQFLSALNGVVLPEEKRKIIGDMFLKIQAQTVKKLKLNPDHWVLGQGTIYPDTIESKGTKYADKIKTHHNRVPEILKLIRQGKVVEPLAELYKDEVRELGRKLGLPKSLVQRHPFPGPGLAVRILCSKPGVILSKAKDLLTDAENRIAKFLAPHGLSGKILPIQSVGVQGDARTYRHPLVIARSAEGATKQSSLSFDELETISTAITNHFPEINRVCLLLAPTQIKKVTLIPATLTEHRIKLLQELDNKVMEFIERHGIEGEMWQFPTVLLPLHINGVKREAVVLRPVCSEEAMTANFYKMAPVLLKKLAKKLAPHVSAILYDMTNKPPGTIEWE